MNRSISNNANQTQRLRRRPRPNCCPLDLFRWRRAIVRCGLFVIFAAALLGQFAQAQQRPTGSGSLVQSPSLEESPSSAPNVSNGRAVQSVGPDIIYVPDKNGDPVPVPAGLTIEDFQRLYQIQQRLTTPTDPPKYSIERTTITGSVDKGRADLTIRISVRVLSDQPLRIPLGLSNSVPRNIPTSDDDRRVTVRFDESDGGYVAWVEAKKDSLQQIELNVLVPVQRVATQSTLNLETPNATVSSIELTVPEKQATVAHSENTFLQTNKSLESGGSKLTFIGGAGVLRLSWSETSQDAVNAASSSLDVDSVLRVRLGGPDSMRTEARFRVQGFGQPVDTVRIRLPADSEVISTSDSPYQVTLEGIEGSDSQVAVFRLPEPTLDRFMLKLSIEQRTGPSGSDEGKRLAAGGFFVEGARHFGHMSLAIEGDWLLRWDESSSVRPTADVPPDLQSETEATVFRFDQQPFELPLTIVRKTTRTSVVPTFVYDVQPDRVELRALLQATVRGAPAQHMLVDFSGWEVYEIADTVAINDDALIMQANPLRIPFARPTRGSFNIEVRARRKVAPTDGTLSFRIPKVLNAISASPTIVAQPADNVQLNLRTGDSSKLMPARVPLDLPVPAGEQSVLCYRLQDSSEDPKIVYDFRLKPRMVQANVTSTVDIRQDSARVEQQISLDVRNVPLDRIVLRVPVPNPDRWSVDDLELVVGGNALIASSDDELATVLAAKAEANGSQADFYFPVFDLPFGAIGNETATVRYHVTPQSVHDEWEVPLTFPEVDQIGTHEAMVHSPEKTSVRIGDNRWSLATEGRNREKTNRAVATAEGHVDGLTVEVNTVSDDDVSSTIVQRAFVQTWSTHSSRRDLAMFRFNSNEDVLAIRLPVGANELQVVLDKEPVLPTQRNPAVFEVDLSNVAKGEHVLEFSYVFQSPLTSLQSLVELPEILDANWTQEFFWQLVLPERTHLVREPANLISANTWGWRGVSWGRTPQHEQAWFEDWIGSSAQPFSPPADSTNRYLYMTFMGVQQLQVSTASRNVITALLVGGAFALGFLFISLEWMRRPLGLLSTTCVFLLTGLAVPASVLALAPPIVFGFCLVALIPLLRTFVTKNIGRRAGPSATTMQRPPSTSVRNTAFNDSKSMDPNATTATLKVPQDA